VQQHVAQEQQQEEATGQQQQLLKEPVTPTHEQKKDEEFSIHHSKQETKQAKPLEHRGRRSSTARLNPETIAVIICGWPSQQASEVAKVCNRRGYNIRKFGLCLDTFEDSQLQSFELGNVTVVRFSDQENAKARLEAEIQECRRERLYPVIVDLSCTAIAVDLYNELKVPFVLESKGKERTQAIQSTETSKQTALISEQMDKQVAALDALWEDWARRFPGLFDGFDFSFSSTHPDDTSGGFLHSISDLLNREFAVENVEPMGEKSEEFVESRIQRKYGFRSNAGKGSSTFTFRQIINQEEKAEGVADSVAFIAQKAQEMVRPRVYNILDVAQEHRFLTL